ncbi:MAG TPA: hypothetical protein VH761_01180, partial [Ilumatobacteraceae bacterium]
FRDCTFDRFDRLAKFWPYPDTTSKSTPWEGSPEFASHGDRQVIVGQYLNYRMTKLQNPGPQLLLVNAYIQVGRAIVWVDPLYSPIPGHPDPIDAVESVLSAATASLEKVFGGD